MAEPSRPTTGPARSRLHTSSGLLLLGLVALATACTPIAERLADVVRPGEEPEVSAAADPEGEDATEVEPETELVEAADHLRIDGDVPGLYGGTGEEGACDPEQLVAFLAAEPDKPRAWASVLDLTAVEATHETRVEAIEDYVEGLSSALLGADTRVRNHGFAFGEATSREVVLQRGTAVLVDDRGVPRVRCACGNPLLPPLARGALTITGRAWDGPVVERLVVVQPATVTIEVLVLVDVTTGWGFERPIGTHGEEDALPPQLVADPEPEPAPAPACADLYRTDLPDSFACEDWCASYGCSWEYWYDWDHVCMCH